MIDRTDKRIRFIIDTCGSQVEHIVALEELSELQKEITKWMRGELDNLAEEIADVYIVLCELCEMHDISKESLDFIIASKLNRTVNRIRREKKKNE